jgi:hypothetical protein
MSEFTHNPSIAAALNDEFRRTTRHILVTPGVEMFDDLTALIMAVRTFDDFTPENDPWGEHDMGALDWHDERVLWKIDYSDPDTGYFQDPQSPDTNRVLTVMLGEEY